MNMEWCDTCMAYSGTCDHPRRQHRDEETAAAVIAHDASVKAHNPIQLTDYQWEMIRGEYDYVFSLFLDEIQQEIFNSNNASRLLEKLDDAQGHLTRAATIIRCSART